MTNINSRVEHIEADTGKPHWAARSEEFERFRDTVKDAGVSLSSEARMMEVLGVERLSQWPGTREQAERAVQDYAIRRERQLLDRATTTDREHGEASVVAWTTVFAPDGTQINVTARQGATPGDVAVTVLALTGAIRELGELGFVAQKRRR